MIPIHFNDRRTGQTTWYIYKAAQKMIEGKTVVVVAENHEQAKNLCRQIFRTLLICLPSKYLERTHTTITNTRTKTSVICVSNNYATGSTAFMKGIHGITLLIDVKGRWSKFTNELVHQMYDREEEVI